MTTMTHALGLMSLIHALVREYGLWGVFIVLTLECMGVPLPGEALLISAAIYAGSMHEMSVGALMAVGSAGATAGGMLGYLIGRLLGLRLLAHYGKYIKLDERRLKVGQYLFLLHGGKIVFFGRFVDVLRIFAGVLAGANRMRWQYFALMNAAGAIFWVVLIAGGAYLFGREIARVAGIVGLLLLVVVVALAVAGIIFFRHHERELEQRAEEAIPGPLMDAPAE
jgi:membrane protein DedA with SNARE-associated domain